MQGPKRTASIARNKLDPDTTKKTKADKNSGAPSAFFFFFMKQFRKDNMENFPENVSISDVVKEGEVIWKSMSNSEKAPYMAKAARKQAEYEIAVKRYNDNLDDVE